MEVGRGCWRSAGAVQVRVPQSTFPRPRWLLKISREGDSTSSLGSLFRCSVTHTVKLFLTFTWNPKGYFRSCRCFFYLFFSEYTELPVYQLLLTYLSTALALVKSSEICQKINVWILEFLFSEIM